jgi:signal peptidase I
VVGEDGAVDPVGSPAAMPPRKASGIRHHEVRWFVEWFIVVVLALVTALLMRAFVFQTFFIPSGSMEPTLQIGDRIIVSKVSVELGTIHRGDILVFRRPPLEYQACPGPMESDLVKRVIGLPNEWLYSTKSTIYWSSTRDGPWHAITKTWRTLGALKPTIGTSGTSATPIYVPSSDYYMIGDHQNDSCDSRYWGPLSRSLAVGKVVLRIWPLSRIGFL